MTVAVFCGTICIMRLAVFVAILSASASVAAAGHARRPAAPPAVPPPVDRTAGAYEQFLRAHLLEEEDTDQAVAAFKRAMALDPASAAIPADLADLYLRENKLNDAIQTAEQALKIAP